MRRTPRNKILNRDGNVCQYCGNYGDQVDHIVPWSITQDDSVENLVVACAKCNNKARDRAFASFADKKEWILNARRGFFVREVRIEPPIYDSELEQTQEQSEIECSSEEWCARWSICYLKSYGSRGPVARLMANLGLVELPNGTFAEPLRPPSAEQISETEKIESEWVNALRRARLRV